MLYPKDIEQKIGFTDIRTMLCGLCISKLGTERVEAMQFTSDFEALTTLHSRLCEMKALLETEEQLPGEDFFDLRPSLRKLKVEGLWLEEQEVWELRRALDTMHSWLSLILRDGSPFPSLRQMADGVPAFHSLIKQIDKLIDRYGHVTDSASRELGKIRLELRKSEGSVSRILIGILESAKQEGLVDSHVSPTIRDGRLMIPISPSLKRRIPGIVHDESATGKTIFIEPTQVVEENNRIRELEAEERREVIRLLQAFTESLRPHLQGLLRSVEFLADVEFNLAKHRLATQLGAVVPQMEPTPLVDWTLARHPLLESALRRQNKKMVPLEIKLSRHERILIISGPNAGGKSVCLKTVGLLQYMLQCGLAVTLGENSKAGIFDSIMIDIGDEQSLDNDLSTYSSHLLNMKAMIRHSNPASLLLIDEFGSGTEPTIGGAIAEATLKRFVQSGTFALITTHYHNLKQFADRTPGSGVANGAMLYDRQQMQPLFVLQVGNPGSSFAIEIARKIGLPEDVIADASDLVGKDYVNADKYLLDIVRDKRYWEHKRQTIHEQEKELQRAQESYEKEAEELRLKRKEIIESAKKEAEALLADSNARIEQTIKEIREAEADKLKTRELRQQLSEFSASVQKQPFTESPVKTRTKKPERVKEHAEGAPPVSIEVGSHVRIKGQDSIGRVEEMKGKRATVIFGQMRTIVDVKRLEPAAPAMRKEEKATAYMLLSQPTQQRMHKTRLSFSPEIDVRGMRVNEVLDAITHYIDDAILVAAARIRILHGTGTGALRQVIRDYLKTIPQVTSARDEHVQFGGAGITVVEFSY